MTRSRFGTVLPEALFDDTVATLSFAVQGRQVSETEELRQTFQKGFEVLLQLRPELRPGATEPIENDLDALLEEDKRRAIENLQGAAEAECARIIEELEAMVVLADKLGTQRASSLSAEIGQVLARTKTKCIHQALVSALGQPFTHPQHAEELCVCLKRAWSADLNGEIAEKMSDARALLWKLADGLLGQKDLSTPLAPKAVLECLDLLSARIGEVAPLTGGRTEDEGNRVGIPAIIKACMDLRLSTHALAQRRQEHADDHPMIEAGLQAVITSAIAFRAVEKNWLPKLTSSGSHWGANMCATGRAHHETAVALISDAGRGVLEHMGAVLKRAMGHLQPIAGGGPAGRVWHYKCATPNIEGLCAKGKDTVLKVNGRAVDNGAAEVVEAMDALRSWRVRLGQFSDTASTYGEDVLKEGEALVLRAKVTKFEALFCKSWFTSTDVGVRKNLVLRWLAKLGTAKDKADGVIHPLIWRETQAVMGAEDAT